MKTCIILILALVGITPTALAQSKFVPDAEIKKVGEIAFQQPRQIVFGFANRGTAPLKISRVVPSCGCVDVVYPQTPVGTGRRAEIVMTYDAKMLGSFYKDIEIYIEDQAEPVILAAQGTVVTEVQDFSEEFPIDLGNVCLKTNYMEFDDVNMGDHPVVELQVLNADRTAYHPELMHLPPYLSAEYLPAHIPAGKVGTIRITLNSEKLLHMGLNQTSIYLSRYMGDKISEKNEISVSAVLLPAVAELSAGSLDLAPELYLSETSVDFGSMQGKSKVHHTVLLTNRGHSDLTIQQLQVFNKAVSVSLGNRTLKPGKSTKLKIEVSADYLKKTKNRPRVLLISNDPRHPKEIIEINVKP